MGHNSIELRFTGSGGQGLILASIILGESAIFEGKSVVQSQVYGAEARGGTTKAEIIISKTQVAFPKVTRPDILAAMTEEGLKTYGTGITKNTILIIDSSIMKLPEVYTEENCKKIYALPFTNIAIENFNKTLPSNMILLGFIISLTNIVKKESVISALEDLIKKDYIEMNKKALGIGFSLKKEKEKTVFKI